MGGRLSHRVWTGHFTASGAGHLETGLTLGAMVEARRNEDSDNAGSVLLWKRAILGARRKAEVVQVLDRRDMAGDMCDCHAPWERIGSRVVI